MSDSTESPPHFMIQQSAIEAAEELGEGDSSGDNQDIVLYETQFIRIYILYYMKLNLF